MKELHALVDFENVQPSLEALAKLAPGFTDVWLFHGPHQAKQAQAFAASHARVTLVPRSGQGPNALDFHLSFYLGYVAAKKAPAAKKAVAKKSTAPKPAKAAQPAKAPTLSPKPTATPEAKLLARITKGLAKMGDKAPTKLKSFLSTLKSMQGKEGTAADAEALAQTLHSKGVVQVQGGVVTYPK